MELLASCSLEQAKNFNGKLVIPNEDEKKPDKVFLNVIYNDGDGSIDDFFTSISKLNKSMVRCVSFPSEEAGFEVPEEWKNRVFIYTDVDTLSDPNYPESDGVVSLVRLGDDFPRESKLNLRDLVSICKEHTSVRFIGGSLLGVEELRVGRFNEGKDKMSPVFKDIYDSFVEVSLDDLDGLKEIISKTRRKAESTNSTKGTKAKVRSKQPKERKSSKRAEAAMKLFGGMEEEF